MADGAKAKDIWHRMAAIGDGDDAITLFMAVPTVYSLLVEGQKWCSSSCKSPSGPSCCDKNRLLSSQSSNQVGWMMLPRRGAWTP